MASARSSPPDLSATAPGPAPAQAAETESTVAIERLRTTVVTVERLQEGRPEEAKDRRRPAMGAGWTVLDRFESNGRRYIVAVEKPGRSRLSAREYKVLLLAALEATNKEIAHELGVAHATVKVLLHRAATKLGVRTRADLIEAFRNQVPWREDRDEPRKVDQPRWDVADGAREVRTRER